MEKLQAENLRLWAENALLKKSEGLDRRKVQSQRFRTLVIHSLKSQYGLDLLLEIRGMARSIFYYHLKHSVMHQNTKRKENVYWKSFKKAKDASDQRWQYQHKDYQNALAQHGILQSMSRKGNCLDNAVMENFFGTMKSEFLYAKKFKSMTSSKRNWMNILTGTITKELKPS